MIPDALAGVLADNSVYGIGAAIVIAAAGFAYTIYNGVRTDRRSSTSSFESAMNERITDLVRQVEEAKAEARECSEQRRMLERENVRLMREIFKLENGHGK